MDSIAAIVRVATDPDRGTLLVHCSAGKDRTGVSLAIMLSAVGVAHDEIVADYARTRVDLEALLDQLRLLPAYEQRLVALPAESLTAEPARWSSSWRDSNRPTAVPAATCQRRAWTTHSWNGSERSTICR